MMQMEMLDGKTADPDNSDFVANLAYNFCENLTYHNIIQPNVNKTLCNVAADYSGWCCATCWGKSFVLEEHLGDAALGGFYAAVHCQILDDIWIVCNW